MPILLGDEPPRPRRIPADAAGHFCAMASDSPGRELPEARPARKGCSFGTGLLQPKRFCRVPLKNGAWFQRKNVWFYTAAVRALVHSAQVAAKVSETTLRQILVDETGRRLGTDARHIVDKITIAHRQGEPNWDADIGMVGLATHKAFAAAREKVRKLYDHDLIWR
jgi:hypothetical protein